MFNRALFLSALSTAIASPAIASELPVIVATVDGATVTPPELIETTSAVLSGSDVLHDAHVIAYREQHAKHSRKGRKSKPKSKPETTAPVDVVAVIESVDFIECLQPADLLASDGPDIDRFGIDEENLLA